MTTVPHSPANLAPLRLGTRRSPLAMAQAEEARARLCAVQGWPLHAVEIVPVTASGDKTLDRPLAEIGGKALWTKELDAWLLAGEIDFAVHSAKDVETIRPDGIVIAAVLPREDVRDVLIGAISIADLPEGARIGTSAPRRAAQMLHFRPDCKILTFRGNVATRLAKLAAGEADATLLAAAGLHRLGRHDIGVPLAVETWLPAPGQGAIILECRANDGAMCSQLGALNHTTSRNTLLAERALLAALGGNCHSAIGVVTQSEGDDLVMHAALFSSDGQDRVDGQVRFVAGTLHGPADLGADLLARAAPSIRALFEGP